MENKENWQFFEIQRYMSKKTWQQLRLQNSKGNEYLDPARMVKQLQGYYAEFFILESGINRC